MPTPIKPTTVAVEKWMRGAASGGRPTAWRICEGARPRDDVSGAGAGDEV